jgi:predicted DNA-binding protein (UPF0251 family)
MALGHYELRFITKRQHLAKTMRPRKCRLVRSSPSARFFKPRGVSLRDIEIVKLKDEEYEAIILADYKGLEQEEAARLMGISRPTFSRTLASARKTIAKVLAEGSALAIDGGDFARVGDKQPDNGETE